MVSKVKGSVPISDWIKSLPKEERPKICSDVRLNPDEFSLINHPIEIKTDVNEHLFG